MPISVINQFVSTAAVNSLLDSAPAPLAGWYATPLLLPAHAGRLHRAAQHVIQARLCAGESCFQQHLLLICCSDTASVSQRHYSELQQVAANAHERALLELIYGQWLACRKLLPAMRHLAEGFRLAAPILASADYFRVLNRHEQLASLSLSRQAVTPQDLPALLTEAAVTGQLQQGKRRVAAFCHRDTLG